MNLSLQLLFHGAIVLLIGQLSGIPYGSAINQKKDEEVVRAWRVAHSVLSMGGTTIIAIAAAIDRSDINTIFLAILVWSLVVSGYGFCVALPYGAWVGERGLTMDRTIKSKIVFAGNMCGAIGSLVGVSVLIFVCLKSMAILS